MAKGLSFTTSRSERLFGTYSHGLAAGDSSELSEDEVWSVINGQDHEPHITHYKSHSDTCISIGRGLSSTLAFHDHEDQYHDHKYKNKTRNIVHKLVSTRGQRHVAGSVPVNIPDWSKIYRVDSVEVVGELNVYDDDDELVPPHEYLAREYRRIATNSVFEGVGRTLKGRDMSRVRDSVWGQTGFNG